MKFYKISTIIVGVLLMVASFFHSYGGVYELKKLGNLHGLSNRDIEGLIVGWVWGSVTMLALGIWCFFMVKSIDKNHQSTLLQTTLLGVLLALFGLFGMLYLNEFNHLAGFFICGLLLLVTSGLLLKNKKS